MKRVLAIFPLLPDPSAFLAELRRRFPHAEFGLYTANAEAAERARQAGLTDVHLQPASAVSLSAPRHLRKKNYDAVVVAATRSHFRFTQQYVLQAMFWFGVKRFVVLDGELVPMWRTASLIVWSLIRYQIPSVAMASLTHLWWLLQVGFAIQRGMKRGRTPEQVRTLWARTRRLLSNPQAYLIVNPARPLLPLDAVTQVMRDFARGPLASEWKESRHLLLIRLDHLGDLIATTGVLTALKKQDPPWRVTLVVGPWSKAVVENDENVDTLLVYPTADPTFRRGKVPSTAAVERLRIRRFLAHQTFDAAVEPASGAEATSLLYLPPARKRATMQFDRWFAHGLAEVIDPDPDEQEPDRLARLLAAAGVDVTPEPTHLALSKDAKDEATRLLNDHGLTKRRFLAIHLGAGWPGRRWPVERFVDVARRAHDQYDLIPVALAGPGEQSLVDAFLRDTRDLGAVAFVKPQLPAIFAIIARAHAFVGNDSAFMHAAAAFNVPTLGLFGPTDVRRFYPTGGKVAATTLGLACSPCPQSYCTDPRCIKELDADRVWRELTDLLKP